jgi:hypothetical protein
MIPIKDLIYGGAIAIILGAFGWYTVHERHEGEAVIVAADTKLAATVAAKDKIIHDNAQLELVDVGNHEKIAIAAAPVPNAGLVCKSPGSTSVASSPGHSGQPVSQGEPVQSGSFDPSGAILTLLRDSDAQVNALIEANEILTGYVNSLK